MKKNFFAIILLIVIIGYITSYFDKIAIKNAIEPRFAIKIINDNQRKVTYLGIGYKIVRYVNISPYESYENNMGVKYGSLFMEYNLFE